MATGIDDGKFIKKPNVKQVFNAEEIDHLTKCCDPVDGPIYFMENFMRIQHPVKGALLMKPYPFQYDMMRTYAGHIQSIILTSRQMGKTTISACYILWYAMFMDDSYILVASKTGDDALDIMDRIRFAYESLPDFIRAGVREYNKKTMRFDNGSVIASATTTASTGRGKSLSMIYLDEFAFVDPPEIAEQLWTSLSPAISTGGKVIMTSTPNSDQDKFAELWFDSQRKIDEEGIPYPNDTIINSKILCLKLETLPKAYVILNTFDKAIPLCFRLKMIQIQPKTKKSIETNIAFSIAQKQQGVDELGEKLSESLIPHFE